jgi:glycerol-3-phosphate cytidylyltransferase
MKKGFACGVFDLFHAGHVLMLQECKQHCDYLVVALNKAENISADINPGKKKPVFSIEERVLVMQSCRYVDEVLVYNSEEELLEILRTQNFGVRFLGEDYRGKPITGAELNIPIYYTDRSHGLSTTLIRSRLAGQ